jgi:hypothetical protein
MFAKKGVARKLIVEKVPPSVGQVMGIRNLTREGFCMETTSESKPAIRAEEQPAPPPLPVSNNEKLAALKEWQKLPPVWIPPATAPPQPDDFRDWGLNE